MSRSPLYELHRQLGATFGDSSGWETARAFQGLEAEYAAARNAVALTELGVQLSQNAVSHWTDDPAATRKEADRLIAGALAVAPFDPEVLAAAGTVAAMSHRPDEAIRHLELSIQHDPNNAHALAMMGLQICLRRNDPSGVDLIELAEARAPHHPRFGLWASYRGYSHLLMLDHEAAALACRQAVDRTPNYYQPHLSLAWALTGLGEPEAAIASAARAQALEGREIVSKFVRESTMWVANSPNAKPCAAVLAELAMLAD